MRASRARRAATAALLLLPFLLRYFPLLRGKVLLASLTALSDQWYINVPFAYLLGGALHAGHLPLWSDRVGGGFPLLAVGEAGVLYPPHLLLYRLLPPLLAYNLNILLAVGGCAVSMYLLCRDYGRSRAASLLGGLAYSSSGFVLVHIATLHSIQAASWTPALLLAVRRAVRSGRISPWLVAGALLALQITTGYPQVVYYSLLAAVLVGVWEGWGGRGVGSTGARSREESAQAASAARAPTLLLTLAGLLLAGCVAAGLSAAHWLPGMELTRLSFRHAGLDYGTATFFSYPPANLLTFIAPYLYGNPARDGNQNWSPGGHFWDNGYIGLLPLALALFAIALLARRDRRVLGMALLFLFSLGVVLGRHTPFFGLLWRVVPGLSFFRFPSRFMVIADLALAVLSAFGLDALCARVARRNGPDASCIPHPGGDTSHAERGSVGASPSPRGRPSSVQTASLTADSAARHSLSAPTPRRILAALILLFSILDLTFFAARFHRFVPAEVWLARPETAALLGGAGCYYTLGYNTFGVAAPRHLQGWMGDLTPLRYQKEILGPNLGALYGLSCFNVYAGLETERLVLLYKALGEDRIAPMTLDPGARRATVVLPRSLAKALALLGVTHVLTSYPLQMEGLRQVGSVPAGEAAAPVRVYAVAGAAPRLWIPRAARVLGDPREALFRVAHGEQAIIEGAIAGHAGCEGQVLSATTGAGFARARVRLSAPGFVIHSQRRYPGWRAMVDGRPVAILPANFVMQGVPVPAGEHSVEFRFEADSYRTGRAISLVTLGLLLGWGAWSLRRRIA